MAKIKIISNPYKKEIVYQKWSDVFDIWTTIDASVSRNSKLLSEELTHGFFPFRAKQIIDAIVEEYSSDDEEIQIVFEGSMDELKDLEESCAGDELQGKVSVEKSDLFLENARDILPEVRQLFQEISPLIHQCASEDKISRDLNRFTDASSDVVPVCVLGNYSAGKSSFINALIGSEILPCGTEPITAKIYKIARSKYADRASIHCVANNQEISICFKDNETAFDCEKTGNPLVDLIQDALTHFENAGIVDRVRQSLSIINDYESNTEDDMISDLIEVEIPFISGVLAKSQHPFVLFDTPGSNSASNAKHLQVLKQAMANMTNGLPIFLCTPEALDSTDNEHLYHIIRDMEELDSRFTMIVVNKADGLKPQTGGILAAEQERTLSQAVPRNLYSGGLFYVSSILGLGAKNNGIFQDESFAETFEEQVYKYNDPSARRYRTLYTLNIMPAQLKHRAIKEAAEQQDLVYANSGLFSVEREIENFAGKYSSYNKCFQSQMFLKNVIKITEDEIEDRKKQKSDLRQLVTDQLKKDKDELSQSLKDTAENKYHDYSIDYDFYLNKCLAGTDKTFSVEELKKKEEQLHTLFEKELGLEDQNRDVKNAVASVRKNMRSRVDGMDKRINFEALKAVASGFRDDAGSVIDSYSTQREIKRAVDKKVSESLLDYVAETYETGLSEVYIMLEKKSMSYWTDKTEELRGVLAEIVTGANILTDERRAELERIIITYHRITFRENYAKEIFNKEKFEHKIQIGGLILWQADRLRLDKLAKVYHSTFCDGVNERCKSIEESHQESAHNWILSLLDKIEENLVEYSPDLSKKAKQIATLTNEIEELIQHQLKLKQYMGKLCEMMDWKAN